MQNKIKFVDLFCGIGGFRYALENAAGELGRESKCVFSCDIDKAARMAYEANFSETPQKDITAIDENEIPTHDILLAGFPCQAFSICGDRKGFEDTRGTLFFDIARILNAKKPKAFILENVKQLRTHNGGATIGRIMETLSALGYSAEYRVLNALDFGLPQKRERVFIVGVRGLFNFLWPEGGVPMKPLSEILERNVARRYYASEMIRKKRLERISEAPNRNERKIWHENKSGNIGVHPYSCALRAGASHNYLLVDGERRLTEREMLRLQGFPEDYRVEQKYSVVKKQTGNSLPVPVVQSIIHEVIKGLFVGRKEALQDTRAAATL